MAIFYLPILQELRLSLAIFGEDVGSRWGGSDPLGRGGYVYRLCCNCQRLSQRGIPFHAYFDDLADGLVPRGAWSCRPCGDQRKCLCDCCRLRISCTHRSLSILRASSSDVNLPPPSS